MGLSWLWAVVGHMFCKCNTCFDPVSLQRVTGVTYNAHVTCDNVCYALRWRRSDLRAHHSPQTPDTTLLTLNAGFGDPDPEGSDIAVLALPAEILTLSSGVMVTEAGPHWSLVVTNVW